MRFTRYQGAVVEDGRILLIECLARHTGQRYWSMPGGGIEPNETEVACIRRELAEETGVSVAVDRVLVDSVSVPGRFYRRQKTFLCRRVGGTPRPGVEPEAEASNFEILNAEWFDLRTDAWIDRLGESWVIPLVHEIRNRLGLVPNAASDGVTSVEPLSREIDGITIRPAGIDDYSNVRTLYPSSRNDSLLRDRLISNAIVVAEADNRISGAIVASEEGDAAPLRAGEATLTIQSLTVSSARLSELLIDAVADHATTLGYERIAMKTKAPDRPTRAFLNRLGFQQRGAAGPDAWFECDVRERVPLPVTRI